ncbi:16S rRNA (adenine(1518)-N(6)/adenine(1519)-N(6))-dimethyltransferase RsmA [Agaribacter marinus]|uniref:16S rRNA (adenine(1518)-N(6)/adenine(1519)-N(6))- dimethyltransferase RsmA n=1 Tax=Agaribacter marinus TaxID=1431249 RepID=UPI0024E0B4B9|nr:16S rRNA (adenine(1518)-N(6)/adenine(1519)-N(6))-dimethyltransferase RsmA [Agaribacter marinus]
MNKTHLGHTARKRFGQNFLHDDYIIDQIVSSINPQDGEHLIEIGPGLGALTEPVAEAVTHLTVVELDRDLATRLRQHPFIKEKLTIIEADALKVDFSSLATPNMPMRIFGNLPYNISTPLMFHLFDHCQHIQDMHFMLQYEVVKRLCAGPGDKLYGRLSVMAQYYCEAVPVLMVPPTAFKPPPKVDSAIVRLIPHKEAPATVQCIRTLQRVVAAAFNQRRKTLKNSLRELIDDAEMIDIGIKPDARAQELSLKEFCAITNKICEN